MTISWLVRSPVGLSSSGFMAASGTAPAASAWTHCAWPISLPSGVTAALRAMFCALNGATFTPLRASSRQRPATTKDLPASLAVPQTSKPPFTLFLPMRRKTHHDGRDVGRRGAGRAATPTPQAGLPATLSQLRDSAGRLPATIRGEKLTERGLALRRPTHGDRHAAFRGFRVAVLTHVTPRGVGSASAGRSSGILGHGRGDERGWDRDDDRCGDGGPPARRGRRRRVPDAPQARRPGLRRHAGVPRGQGRGRRRRGAREPAPGGGARGVRGDRAGARRGFARPAVALGAARGDREALLDVVL